MDSTKITINYKQLTSNQGGLGGWIHYQRVEYTRFMNGKKSSLTAEKVKRLTDTGFVFRSDRNHRGTTTSPRRRKVADNDSDDDNTSTSNDDERNGENYSEDDAAAGLVDPGRDRYETSNSYYTLGKNTSWNR